MSSWAAMLPEEVWEHVFSFLTANSDRNAVSLVCRGWYHIERRSRRGIFVANCYAVTPAAAVGRFTGVRAAYNKGKPRYAASTNFPREWGGGAESWVTAMAKGWPQLEEVHLKRMVVNGDCLELIARSLKNLRVLALSNCDGVTTKGLAAVAANCSLDEEFIPVIEHLVNKCTNIQTLRLNGTVPLGSLVNLLHSAPQLTDLGTHLFSRDYDPKLFFNLESAFANCKGMMSLHLLSNIVWRYLPAIYLLWDGLISLDLCYCLIQRCDLIKMLSWCKNLQRLWVRDYIGDDGLDTVASSCKLLQELRVFPPFYHCQEPYYSLTEHGLVIISMGCPMLQYVLYICDKMTNAALIAVARNRPNLRCFRLCTLTHRTPDYVTQEPLDVGFSAIVESCKDLRRLSLAGLLTDDVFRSIGASANRLEMLSVCFNGESDVGLHYILSGCKSLWKLDICNCPFGDMALTFTAAKLEKMQHPWMSECLVSLGACRFLAQVMPWLNLEVIDETIKETLDSLPDNFIAKRLYVYKTLAGRRSDKPPSVWTVRGVLT